MRRPGAQEFLFPNLPMTRRPQAFAHGRFPEAQGVHPYKAKNRNPGHDVELLRTKRQAIGAGHLKGNIRSLLLCPHLSRVDHRGTGIDSNDLGTDAR